MEGFLFGQVLEQPGIEFDARKFGYLGAISMENSVLWVTKASGVTTIDQFMASKTPVKLGGVGIGTYAPGWNHQDMEGGLRFACTTGNPLQGRRGHPAGG